MITKQEISELTTPSIKQMITMMQDELNQRQRAKRAELINQFKQAYWALRDECIEIQYETYEDTIYLNDCEKFYFV